MRLATFPCGSAIFPEGFATFPLKLENLGKGFAIFSGGSEGFWKDSANLQSRPATLPGDGAKQRPAGAICEPKIFFLRAGLVADELQAVSQRERPLGGHLSKRDRVATPAPKN